VAHSSSLRIACPFYETGNAICRASNAGGAGSTSRSERMAAIGLNAALTASGAAEASLAHAGVRARIAAMCWGSILSIPLCEQNKIVGSSGIIAYPNGEQDFTLNGFLSILTPPMCAHR
jgi:hypothetical protein